MGQFRSGLVGFDIDGYGRVRQFGKGAYGIGKIGYGLAVKESK